MSDPKKLKKARELVTQGEHAKARKILEMITSKDASIRLEVLLTFLVVLDHVTENDKLLAVANEGIEITSRTGNESVRSYLLGRKSLFLLSELSMMIYRQKNLMLSANVFEWIDFSLERDKKEYAFIVEKRKEIESEIESIIATVIERAETGIDHYFRGHLFSTIGDFYSSKYLCDALDFQKGGRTKSKIANMYWVRRWNLDKFLYGRDSRRKIIESKKKCIEYFERAIKEFELAGKKSEEANMIYNLAAKLMMFNQFRRAKKLLTKARAGAESLDEKPLLGKIGKLEKEVENKNHKIRDYVSEMGLDMP